MNLFFNWIFTYVFRGIFLPMMPAGGGSSQGGNSRRRVHADQQEGREDEDPFVRISRLEVELNLVRAERNQLQADLLEARNVAIQFSQQNSELQTQVANLLPVQVHLKTENKKEQDRSVFLI